MVSAVLDASAVLAVLNAEPGAESVTDALDDALLSAVNYAEVIGALVERGATLDQARSICLSITLNTVDFDLPLAERAGELRRRTKHLRLSLADRACLALAEREGVPALTSDRKWSQLGSGFDVRIIR